jgi:hypothetical protein
MTFYLSSTEMANKLEDCEDSPSLPSGAVSEITSTETVQGDVVHIDNLTRVHICGHNNPRAQVDEELEFEWDESKARTNLEKHGVSFFTAVAIFRNERIERIDEREDYGEIRWIGLGRAGLEVYRVIFTWRSENRIRIISAQRANRNEHETYYREVHP